MGKVNFNDRTFVPVANSEKGEVSGETIFRYKQDGDLVTADYSGGTIKHGRIIAKQLPDGDLKMVYNCLTTDGELKSGKANAKVLTNESGRIEMHLNWEWLEGDKDSGTSKYVEID